MLRFAAAKVCLGMVFRGSKHGEQGVNKSRLKCNYDGKKRERREVRCWGNTSQVGLFQQ
jgi:hypothetical protein